ncbi:hypothetical protein MCY_01515 [Bartonella rattimassiliensis 15908]|uniref:Uncharacterized protein n=1 Tax=Bartonella rattimassiliensis 15908 TaxID=1094556 RepID=J0QJA2_9HYPH|nr:hypothetical protein MCY_01515 [Bartonella rattimassiliensis 15908]
MNEVEPKNRRGLFSLLLFDMQQQSQVNLSQIL